MKHTKSLCTILALALTACGSDDDASTGKSTVAVTGIVRIGSFPAGLGGVEICAPELADVGCVTSAGDGTFTLGGLQKNTRVVITAEKELFASALGYFELGDEDLDTNISLQELALVEQLAAKSNIPFDASKGAIGIVIEDQAGQGQAGWKASLTPAVGDGPYYWNDTASEVDPTADATSPVGAISVVNMPAGTHSLKLDGPGTCIKDHYTVTTGTNEWEVVIRSGFFTYQVVVCPPN
ncbi:MAG TPA: hypothetical protein PKA88_05975 [Polyangiaceae bacterium]|nr:hypothetical protein [Polyangiaceae bacterium]HMR73683.1 hypothetical protein [Polyangiaceae bacterium]